VGQIAAYLYASKINFLNARVSHRALQQPRQLFMQKMTDALSSLKLLAHDGVL
jgi:hypothetical protein